MTASTKRPWAEPFERFEKQFAEFSQKRAKDPNAMILATADAKGAPSARVVLLKGIDAKGFVFFTNYDSRKGRELKRKKAALCFYWPELDQQIRVEGTVAKVTAAESNAYFATRKRGSQLGAWASAQSAELPERSQLEARLVEYTARFAGREVPRPPHWGGYRLHPEVIEFWYADPNRLHTRDVFRKQGKGWSVVLLNP